MQLTPPPVTAPTTTSDSPQQHKHRPHPLHRRGSPGLCFPGAAPHSPADGMGGCEEPG